jgi:hypothetical protein
MAELTADDICWEVSRFLRTPLPRDRYAQWLAAKADLCLQGNALFRRKMMGPKCREWLRAFTRHWLTSLLYVERPDLWACLPESFDMGTPLPGGRHPRINRRGGVTPPKALRWQPARVLVHPRWRFLAAA